MRAGLIGIGAIGRFLLESATSGLAGAVSFVAVASRRGPAPPGLRSAYFEDASAFLSLDLDLVVEAASQQAVRDHLLPLLSAGVDVVVLSAGALVDGDFCEAARETARRSGARVYVPSGAIAGVDALRAAGLAGLTSVVLTTTKPPAALDLPGLDGEPTMLFDGNVADAVALFPQNVNVAAIIGLAGGVVDTRVRIVCDAAATGNTHEVHAEGDFGSMDARVINRPTPGNPRTSLLACLSALALLRRLSDPIQIG